MKRYVMPNTQVTPQPLTAVHFLTRLILFKIWMNNRPDTLQENWFSVTGHPMNCNFYQIFFNLGLYIHENNDRIIYIKNMRNPNKGGI